MKHRSTILNLIMTTTTKLMKERYVIIPNYAK